MQYFRASVHRREGEFWKMLSWDLESLEATLVKPQNTSTVGDRPGLHVSGLVFPYRATVRETMTICASGRRGIGEREEMGIVRGGHCVASAREWMAKSRSVMAGSTHVQEHPPARLTLFQMPSLAISGVFFHGRVRCCCVEETSGCSGGVCSVCPLIPRDRPCRLAQGCLPKYCRLAKYINLSFQGERSSNRHPPCFHSQPRVELTIKQNRASIVDYNKSSSQVCFLESHANEGDAFL